MIVDRHIAATISVGADTVAARRGDVGEIIDDHISKHRCIRRKGRPPFIPRKNSRGPRAVDVKRWTRIDGTLGGHDDRTCRDPADLRNRCRLVVSVDPAAAGCNDVACSSRYGNASGRVREGFDPIPVCTGNVCAPTCNGHVPGAEGKSLDTVIRTQDIPGWVDRYIAWA